MRKLKAWLLLSSTLLSCIDYLRKKERLNVLPENRELNCRLKSYLQWIKRGTSSRTTIIASNNPSPDQIKKRTIPSKLNRKPTFFASLT